MIEETTTTEAQIAIDSGSAEADFQQEIHSEHHPDSALDNNLLLAGAIWVTLLSISLAVWGGLAYLLFTWLAG